MKRVLTFFFLFCLHTLTAQYIPGKIYYGEHEYIEYLAGNTPFIISAPHGGELTPSEIPDRDCSGCSYVKDSYTQELARETAAAFHQKTGCYPHIIINRLHRIKLDANRDIEDAADGNSIAENAWEEFHQFIDSAKQEIESKTGVGLYFDLHGHAHSKQRIELGYLLTGTDLRMSDTELDTPGFYKKTSIVHLIENHIPGNQLSEAIRNFDSFGEGLTNLNFPAVPSASDPFPVIGDPFFSGGYNTRRHGSRDGGSVSGIQVECNQNIRFDSIKRKEFADALANAIISFYSKLLPDYTFQTCQIGVGVENISENQFKIYPNPASKNFKVKASEFPVKLQLFNIAGFHQKTFQIHSAEEIFPVTELKAGVYFFKIIKKGKTFGMKKLIILND